MCDKIAKLQRLLNCFESDVNIVKLKIADPIQRSESTKNRPTVLKMGVSEFFFASLVTNMKAKVKNRTSLIQHKTSFFEFIEFLKINFSILTLVDIGFFRITILKALLSNLKNFKP